MIKRLIHGTCKVPDEKQNKHIPLPELPSANATNTKNSATKYGYFTRVLIYKFFRVYTVPLLFSGSFWQAE